MSFRGFSAGLGACLVFAAPATAAEYLEKVEGPVFQAEGTRAELAKRAVACLAKAVRQERSGPQTVQVSDPDAGVIVASTIFTYSTMGVPWTARSTLTVETKDGRFRLTHTALQHKSGTEEQGDIAGFLGLNSGPNGSWIRVGKWWGAGGARVEGAAQELSGKVAFCIKAPVKDDW